MSDDLESVKQLLERKTAYANELLSQWQTKDGEVRKLSEERKRLNERIEELQKKLRHAEGRLADRERDHHAMQNALVLVHRAYNVALDGLEQAGEMLKAWAHTDTREAALAFIESHRAEASHALRQARDDYATKAQERLLLKIFKEGALTQGTKEELTRLLESRMEYFRDADHWAEALELLEQQKEKPDVRSESSR